MKLLRSPAAEWALYIALALVAIGPALRSNHVVGDGIDMYGTIWFYWWIQECLQTLSDPGFTDYFFYPLGKDIFAHTGNNFVDAVVAAPFYWLFGSPGYQRWFVLAVLLANAASFRVLARGMLQSRGAQILATVAFMLNPYVLFEITCGRLTQAFLPFMPLAFHFLLQLERPAKGWARLKAPLLAGLMVALQAWTYWFMGYFMALAMLPIFLHAVYKSERRGELIANYLMAGAACLLFVSPAALSMSELAGAGAVPGLDNSVQKDLFQPPAGLGNNVASNLHGWVFAEFAGTPLLISLAWTPLWLAMFIWGKDRARWVPAFLLLWYFSLGPTFHTPAPGVRVLAVSAPYMAAYHYLPFFDRLWFPYRMMSVAFLVLSVGLGQLADRAFTSSGWRLRKAAPALAVLFMAVTLGEQARYRVFPFVSRDLTMPATYEMIRDNPGYVIHLPFGISQPSIIWQTFHGQKMFGGMGENAPILLPEGFQSRMNQNSFVRSMNDASRRPGMPVVKHLPAHREAFEAQGFRWVVLHRDLVQMELMRNRTLAPDKGAVAATQNLVELLGEPVAVEGVLVTWDLSGQLGPLPGYEPTAQNLGSADFESQEIPAYERALIETGRLIGPPELRPEGKDKR